MDMARRAMWLVLVCVLAGCAHGPETGTFDRLALGLSGGQVEELLGKPAVRYQRMWEYRLASGEAGYVAFDSRGLVTAWLREPAPQLRSGMAPLTWETYQRLQLGTGSESLLALLGQPTRRQEGRWYYLTPSGYELALELDLEGMLIGKSWERPAAAQSQVVREAPEAEAPPPPGDEEPATHVESPTAEAEGVGEPARP